MNIWICKTYADDDHHNDSQWLLPWMDRVIGCRSKLRALPFNVKQKKMIWNFSQPSTGQSVQKTIYTNSTSRLFTNAFLLPGGVAWMESINNNISYT
jgi:hypothetical protein